MATIVDQDHPDSLLTSKALAASLSPPRVPPIGSAHRELLLGRDPGLSPWMEPQSGKNPFSVHRTSREEEEAHSRQPHNTLRERLRDRLRTSHNQHSTAPAFLRRRRLPHPHLPAGPELGDQITRFLGVTLPLEWQHRCRDSGLFRSICDAAATLAVPSAALSNPSCLATFGTLSAQCRRVLYGPHPLHRIDVYLPKEQLTNRLVFFVHGGAWGSGQPWMYRLVAAPFVAQGWAVAIPGYRTYPDGTAFDQVADCERAARQLAVEYPQLVQSVTVMGHSSGAHIALLMLVRRLELKQTNSDTIPRSFQIGAFVGLSGPYDISHHFDYEAARGVEELSPMKPCCGFSREGFRLHSPTCRFPKLLARMEETSEHVDFPTTLLLHGIEDSTVPFTASAEAARVMRSCGVSRCYEMYLANTGHQDTVVQLMLGGRTQGAVVEWLRNLVTTPTNLNRTELLSVSKL